MRSIVANFELLSLSDEISELKEMANDLHDHFLVRDPCGATFASNGQRIAKCYDSLDALRGPPSQLCTGLVLSLVRKTVKNGSRHAKPVLG